MVNENVERVEKWLEHFKYKYNFQIEIDYSRSFDKAVFIVIKARFPSIIRKGGQLNDVWLFSQQRLSPQEMHNERSFYLLLRKMIHAMELHEIDENITVDDIRIFNPHDENLRVKEEECKIPASVFS